MVSDVIDFLCRGSDLHNLSFYEFIMFYKKARISDVDYGNDGCDTNHDIQENEHRKNVGRPRHHRVFFDSAHPEHDSKLMMRAQKPKFPKIAFIPRRPTDQDPNIELTADLNDERERYAKFVLAVFAPLINENRVLYSLGELQTTWWSIYEKFLTSLRIENEVYWKQKIGGDNVDISDIPPHPKVIP